MKINALDACYLIVKLRLYLDFVIFFMMFRAIDSGFKFISTFSKSQIHSCRVMGKY